MKKVVITSGFFNPTHVGHINLIRESKKLGDFLVVIVNNDEQVKLKGSVPFMPENERVEIIKALKYVDDVFLAIDSFADGKEVPIPKSLEMAAQKYPGELFFAKGGDRDIDHIPWQEKEICDKYNIKVVTNVGGEKIQSSSWLLNNVIKP
jgi:D-beta-D-heptose 7-phosphate kinase/D-beta-D-heptose 1-phosphate adenosyltransferase